MTYQYKCEKCEVIQDIELPMLEDHPKFVKCKCGNNAYRCFSTYKVHIPGSFQSMNELYNNDTASDFNYISDRMKHGTRPSGKQKILY